MKDSWQLLPVQCIDALGNVQDATKQALAVPLGVSYKYQIPCYRLGNSPKKLLFGVTGQF